jgi:hypothetical protein
MIHDGCFPAAACSKAMAEVACDVGRLAEQVRAAAGADATARGLQLMCLTELQEAAAAPRFTGVKQDRRQQQQRKKDSISDATDQCLLAIGSHIEQAGWPPGPWKLVTAAELWDFVSQSARHWMSGEQLARLHAGLKLQQRQQLQAAGTRGWRVNRSHVLGAALQRRTHRHC